ncbi:MAG: hypothetical protein ACE5I1_16090, partial [bacterium]
MHGAFKNISTCWNAQRSLPVYKATRTVKNGISEARFLKALTSIIFFLICGTIQKFLHVSIPVGGGQMCSLVMILVKHGSIR